MTEKERTLLRAVVVAVAELNPGIEQALMDLMEDADIPFAASRLSAQRPAPSPRPTVEQLVEIGLSAWNVCDNGTVLKTCVRAIARAVRAADAPAVPKEIWERLEKGHPVSDKDWDDLYILMRDVRNWARTLPTAPPIPDALREKAREIAERMTKTNAWLEAKAENEPHWASAYNTLADVCNFVRELAAQP